MRIFSSFVKKLIVRGFSAKRISRDIERNLIVGPTKLIETVIEILTPSLSSEHIDEKNFSLEKFCLKKAEGAVLITHQRIFTKQEKLNRKTPTHTIIQ